MEEQNLSDSARGSRGKISFLNELVATGLGSGYSPVASGTAGSLVGLLIYLIPGFEKIYIIVPMISVFLIWGAYAAGKMEKEWGHDPSRVVIDEIVGMWISIAFIPKGFVLIAIAFLIFRLLDIFKPFPANYFDKKSGGFAVMLDDVVCGIYANILIQFYLYFIK
ncbi:MAG: phosphatidylglycerophosphatase A [Candidatus Kryptoniota bacterium]